MKSFQERMSLREKLLFLIGMFSAQKPWLEILFVSLTLVRVILREKLFQNPSCVFF